MNKMKVLLTLLAGMYLVGCATGAQMENMVYHGEPKSYSQAITDNMSVNEVTGGKKTNPAWTSEIDNDAFSHAVKTSLELQGLYADAGQYLLDVTLLEVDQPLLGINMEVTTHVRYVLTRANDGAVVFDETIVAPHTATMGDAFVGATRLRMANEGSAKKNIAGLLEKLASANIDAGQISMNQ